MSDRRFDVSRWPGRDHAVRLPDGRRLQTRLYGDEAGLPLLMLHGTPGSRIMFAGMDKPARARGVRIVALDRWSYGDSDAPAKPSLATFAADVGALMSDLGAPTFAVAGVSGGGPYTAAIACHLPTRVRAAGLISPVGLVREATHHGEVDRFHRFCFDTLPLMPRTVTALFGGYARAVRLHAGLACGLTTFRAPAADKAIMTDCATSDRLLAAFHEGLRTNARGPSIDLKLFQAIDTLDLSRASMPTRVWIGTDDRNVPVAAARRLAARLPACTLEELPAAGHLWVAHNYDRVLAWLAAASA